MRVHVRVCVRVSVHVCARVGVRVRVCVGVRVRACVCESSFASIIAHLCECVRVCRCVDVGVCVCAWKCNQSSTRQYPAGQKQQLGWLVLPRLRGRFCSLTSWAESNCLQNRV